jgi:hypothetical protein
VVSNSILNFNIFGDITRGDLVTINYFDYSWVFELIMRKGILAYESLINQAKSSISTIHKYIGINFDNFNIIIGQGIWYN